MECKDLALNTISGQNLNLAKVYFLLSLYSFWSERFASAALGHSRRNIMIIKIAILHYLKYVELNILVCLECLDVLYA